MIYIPLESFVREGDFGAFLAAELSSVRVPILIGDQRVLQSVAVRDANPCVYIDKSLAKNKSKWYSNLPESLFLISHDLEFTGVYRGVDYIVQRFGEVGSSRVDKVVFHDRYELRSVLAVRPDLPALGALGSWYFESLVSLRTRRHKEILEARDKFGADFIFVPSNFGGFFHSEGVASFGAWIFKHFPELDSADQFRSKIISREKERMLFVDALISLAQSNSKKTFVLRPHPTETELAWSVFPFPNNVVISKSFTTAIMTAASSLVIHNCCTTVIDANVLDVPQLVLKTSSSQDSWPFWSYINAKIDVLIQQDWSLDAINLNGSERIEIGSVCCELSKLINDMHLNNSLRSTFGIALLTVLKSWLLVDTGKFSKADTKTLARELNCLIKNRSVVNLGRAVLIL